MSLKAWRPAIERGLESVLGVNVYPWSASAVDPPCALVEPAANYVSDVEDETSFDLQLARWVVMVVVRIGDDALDDLDDFIDLMPAAAAAIVPPEDGGTVPTVEEVRGPALVEIGSVQYVGAEVVLAAYRPTP